jgi:16S rRNA (guanine(966)-N(2))-methyltransferase RsmD
MSAAGRVRIEAGRAKGRALSVPQGARPTEGRVRGALFSIWAERVDGARFLDLFAGSGAVGIEALSRGALETVFAERGREALEILTRNVRQAGPFASRILRGELPGTLEGLARAGDRFDLVFADPPYGWTVTPELFRAVAALAAPGCELAIEHSRRSASQELAEGWVRRELRKYGDSAVSFYRRD